MDDNIRLTGRNLYASQPETGRGPVGDGIPFIGLTQTCNILRNKLGEIEQQLRNLMDLPDMNAPDNFPEQRDEMRSQAIGAAFCVEEARRKVGKILLFSSEKSEDHHGIPK